jgi:hypothetical protein
VPRRPTLVTWAIANLLAVSDDYKTGNLVARTRAQLRATRLAGEAVGFLWAVTYAYQTLDREAWITQVEYAQLADIDERTAQRHWARFRAAFPTESSPERLGRWLLSQGVRDAAAATAVEASDSLALAA